MIVKRFLTTLLQISSNENNTNDIDHILLHIRCKSLINQTLSERKKAILMGLPFIWLLELVMFPLAAISRFRTLALSFIAAAVPYFVFEVLDLQASLIMWILVWAGLNINYICQKFFELIFDILDSLLLGRLTELLVSSYSSLAIEKQRNIITKYNAGFIQHLFTSRVRFGNSLHEAWANHFLDVFSNFVNDQSILNSEIENYWLVAKETDSIYNKFYPIEMSDHLNWIEQRDWPRATPAVVKFVLNRIPNINETQTSRTDSGFTGPQTLLGSAAAGGASIELVEMIVGAGADVNFKQLTPMSFRDYEFSIIHCAVAGSNFEVVKYLLDNGVNLEKAYKNHLYTIAQFATLFAIDANVLGLIIEKSDRTNLTDENGNTLLHYALASSTDRSSQISLLAKKGMDINITNDRGETPVASFANRSVHIIGQEGYPNLNNLMTAINLGADPNIKTDDNSTPLGLLAFKGRFDNKLVDAAKVLVAAGAEIDVVDEHGRTPLFLANDPDLTKYLLSQGANPNKSIDDMTPFTSAVRMSVTPNLVTYYIKLIEIFLSFGCNPKTQVYSYRNDMTAADVIIQRLETQNFDFAKLKKKSPIRKLID